MSAHLVRVFVQTSDEHFKTWWAGQDLNLRPSPIFILGIRKGDVQTMLDDRPPSSVCNGG